MLKLLLLTIWCGMSLTERSGVFSGLRKKWKHTENKFLGAVVDGELKKLDTDHDGKLTLHDLELDAKKVMDRDHDGKITAHDFSLNSPAESRIDCAVSPWRRWRACTAKCDGKINFSEGSQVRTRMVLQQPAHGGRSCPLLVERKKCELKCVVPSQTPTLEPTHTPTSEPTMPPAAEISTLNVIAGLGALVALACLRLTFFKDYRIIIEKKTSFARHFWYAPLDLDHADGPESRDEDGHKMALSLEMADMQYDEQEMRVE
jgi:hypothetical protein